MRISRNNREGRRNLNLASSPAPFARAAPIPSSSPDKYQLSRQLLGYQQDRVFDHSRFKFGLMARQTGKVFSAAYEGIYDCLLHEVQRSFSFLRFLCVLLLSPFYRQHRKLLLPASREAGLDLDQSRQGLENDPELSPVEPNQGESYQK